MLKNNFLVSYLRYFNFFIQSNTITTKKIQMKISYNTLKKYIPELESPEKVAEKLILHSAEVEGIEKQ